MTFLNPMTGSQKIIVDFFHSFRKFKPSQFCIFMRKAKPFRSIRNLLINNVLYIALQKFNFHALKVQLLEAKS